ncbi:MAG: Brp/Blh family beta-carotene 15,15'-dioxygenase, partial [Robiginitalea sp.]|uniref:Brp/Blh family beta-carotene 15,15'-dioxygenase n=1 Tax=Robiginitalea sp. TaxID=1902411 RepID=UPI003C76381D
TAGLRNAMMVTTFFFLWLAIFFGETVEETLAFTLIFSFGILHGANDLEILRRKGWPDRKLKSGRNMLIAYVGFVILSALLFYLIPMLALVIFISFSAYHFGEQHWITRRGKHLPLQKLLFFTYGLVVLFLLFCAHTGEVTEVILGITGVSVPTIWFGRVLLVSLGLFVVILCTNFFRSQLVRYALREFLLLGLFFLVFNTASLLWAFAIYFVVWHSIPSLADQLRLLYGTISLKSGLQYVKSSAVYWVGALVTLAVAFLVLKDSDFGYLPLFFSFLAAITFPHVLVITRLYGQGENE